MTKRRRSAALAEAALIAVESGQISVEELLAGGAARIPRFRAWLANRLGRLPQGERAEPQIRHRRRSREEVAAILTAARAQFGAHPGVRHIAWGSKTVGGHPVPRDCLVFLVDAKRRDLADGAAEKIPESVSLETPLGVRVVETDVREIAKGVHHAGAVSAGFHCGVQAGSNLGCLGCVTTVGGVAFAIVSGHVAVQKDVAITATSVSGGTVPLGPSVVVKNDADVDAARVGPVPDDSLGGLADVPTSVRDLDESDTRLAIHISVPRGTLYAAVDTVSEPATFLDPATGAGHAMNALIRLDQGVTLHGDSGAPAMDATGLLVGFVEGIADGRTYLIPAGRAIHGVS